MELRQAFRVIRNKYLLTAVATIVWVLFFDRNDLFTQLDLVAKCKKLNSEKDYYIREIAANRQNLSDLKTNRKSLETLAREKYLMKKENEEVYVFVAR